MKKIIIIILLISFLFNTLGVYVVFYVLRYENKERIKELISNGISEEYLTILKIPEKSAKENNALFQRIESDEIKYKDNMYDIVKEERHNGFIYFYCINDEKEDELISSLDNYIAIDATSNQLKNKHDLGFLKQLFKDFSKEYTIFPTQYFYFAFFSNDAAEVICLKTATGYTSILIAPPWLL